MYADTGSLKSLLILFDKHLDHLLVNLEKKIIVRTNICSLELFDQKRKKKVSFDMRLRQCGKYFCSCNNCLMLNYYFSGYYLSVFPKLRKFNTCNQITSCTKHDRLGWKNRMVTLMSQITI